VDVVLSSGQIIGI